MILEMYAVYDKKVQAFQPPMFFRARGEALRAFMDAVGDVQTPFCKHPEDYSFAFVGTFDDFDGKFHVPDAGPLHIMQAIECMKKE